MCRHRARSWERGTGFVLAALGDQVFACTATAGLGQPGEGELIVLAEFDPGAMVYRSFLPVSLRLMARASRDTLASP